MKFRWAEEADFNALGEVMYDAVHNGPSPYSEAQRRAWVSAPRTGEAWRARLAGQAILVAEAGGRINGFMSLAEGGYVDFAYIRAEARGSGLFRNLYAAIEARARQDGAARMWTHASLAAEPAFAAMGFVVSAEETVEIAGERLRRFKMEKPL